MYHAATIAFAGGRIKKWRVITVAKYDKNIFQPIVMPWPHGVLTELAGEEHGMSFSVVLTGMDHPVTPETTPMVHDFDQMLWFAGPNPMKPMEFDAEIEYYFGKEREKHVITTPSVIYQPKGTIHAPLIFKKVNKPVLVVDVRMTPTYKKTLV
jgi:hypothetical protein